MKNKLNTIAAVLILLILIIGCRSYNPLAGSSDDNSNSSSANKDLSERAIDSTLGEEKIGVPECDEIIDFFDNQSKDKDDDFVTKAARGYAMNKIRESFRQSIEENKGDKTKLAKECREFKRQLDKYKPDDNSNKK